MRAPDGETNLSRHSLNQAANASNSALRVLVHAVVVTACAKLQWAAAATTGLWEMAAALAGAPCAAEEAWVAVGRSRSPAAAVPSLSAVAVAARPLKLWAAGV